MHDRTPRSPLPTQLHVVAWCDSIVDRIGFEPHSAYSELLWLPTLGPGSTMAWRRLAGMLDHRPDGFDLDTAQFACDMGLGTGLGSDSTLSRTLHRLAAFQLTRFVDPSTYAVRRRIPPAATGRLRKLNPELQRIHAAFMRRQAEERSALESPASTPQRRGA